LTKSFETEAEAKQFARIKYEAGLLVTAGTINPHLPRRAVPSRAIPLWLGLAEAVEEPDEGRAREPTTRTD
jgi:hypothetical protein